MKSLKDNTLIKWVYAYIDLFYKLFPLLFLIYFLPILLNIPSLKWKSADVFGIFKQSFADISSLSEISFLYKTIVLIVNISVIAAIYYSLRKLSLFMKNVYNENPFCVDNGKILKFIGSLVVVITIGIRLIFTVTTPAESFGFVSITNSLLIRVVGFLSIFFSPYFVIGLFVMVIGEIIIHGVEIKEENDLTV